MADKLLTIQSLVANLPELYQPIYGHQSDFGESSRDCEDRLKVIAQVYEALTVCLGRPLRVLDLGCAQGYFSLSLANLGANVLGIDALAENISLCQALEEQNPALDVTFKTTRIEDLLEESSGSFDIVLGLSVFHHLAHQNGVDETKQLVAKILERNGLLLIETALSEEPLYWASSLPEEPSELISGAIFRSKLATFKTHLSSIERPMFFASDRFVLCNQIIMEIERSETISHALSKTADWQDTRRYFWSADAFAKQYFFRGIKAAVNEDQASTLLKNLARDVPNFRKPRLLSHLVSEDEALVVMEQVSGEKLLDMILAGTPYDPRSVCANVLEQLKALEDVELFHSDLRTWNVILDETHTVQLIDLDSVVPQDADCVPPQNLFLAFFMFAHEVYSREVIDPIDREMYLLAPHNLHPDLREIADEFWQVPANKLSFGYLQSLFESLPLALEAERASPSLSAPPFWYTSIEHFHSVAANRAEERNELLSRLNDAEAQHLEDERQRQSVLARADAAEEKASAAEEKAGAAENRASAAENRASAAENRAREDRAGYEAIVRSWSWRLSLPLRRFAAAGVACKAGVRRILSRISRPFAKIFRIALLKLLPLVRISPKIASLLERCLRACPPLHRYLMALSDSSPMRQKTSAVMHGDQTVVPTLDKRDVDDLSCLSAAEFSNSLRFPMGAPTLFYFVDHTIDYGGNTGMQRVVRQLGRALLANEANIVFVKWDEPGRRIVLVNQADLTLLENWSGPRLKSEQREQYPAPGEAPRVIESGGSGWLVVTEVPHITPHQRQITLDLITSAKTKNLKTAFIFYDATPLKEDSLRFMAEQHEAYMQTLILADLVLPISKASQGDLTDFFETHQMASPECYPEVVTLPIAAELPATERATRSLIRVQSENLILSVGSITPHKNQLTLLEAFQEYVNDNPDTDWRLLLVGGVAPELQSRVESIVQQCSAICVESQMGDAGLFDAYRRAAFTVFPSVAEGYGLPIVESLWFGKPCVCANFGAMAEVAEGGGCLSINIRDKAELQQAIRRLIDSEALREELSAAAGSRHFETWEGYASKFVALISEASNGLRQLGTVFYPVTHTCQHPRNSGIQRVVRGLARSLIDNGVSVVPVMFDENDRVFAPVPQERLDHLSQWNGPSPDDWSAWKNPSNGSNRDWMLCAELTHGYTAELIDAAKSSSLRAAYVFYDAIPYKMTDIYPPEASIAHERYMAALNSCELVLPISQFSRRDLLQFLGKSQFATPNLFERVRACILPGEFLEHDRVLDDGQRTNADANQERVARILSVGTVEPRKNHLTLLKAFELVRARAVTRVELCIAGGGPFDNLAEEVEKFIEVTPGVTWERSADDSRLRELYEWCDFTVYPSLEEGFGLPIVESIWNGKPCVCHNDGAMSEVAGPGCVRVDAASVEQLSTALIELVESGEALTSLAAEAIKAEIKTWQGYGAEVGSALANERQPIPDQIEPARSSREDLYSLMPNITQRPLLSICISTYNRARWLTVSLHHLSRLIPEYSPDIEIVVCDNASTDDTPAVVEPYLSRQDFAYHRNPHNVGMLGNLRVTAHHAKGKYIWILGDDDLLRSGAIDKVVHTLHSNPDLALVYLNYAFHREDEPSSVDGIDALFNDSTPVSPPSGDEKGLVCEMAANSENFFTAIYCLVFRRDHALRAYSEKTDGRPFAAMRDCIPTTYYVLHHMMNEQGAWLGQPQLTVNLNVSWMKYATLWILERLPEAHDLAEKMGADRAKVDEVRAAHFPHVAHWFEVIYADDPEGNAAYFKPDRLVSRVNHLRGFKEIEPHLRHIYSAKRQAGHPACHLPAGEVFYDEPPSAE